MLSIIAISLNHSAIAQVITDDVDVSAVVPSNEPPGGGSSGSGSAQATIVLSGQSFPGAKLKLLKDGAVSTTLFANPDGTFQITINNLTYGNYQLSLFAEDSTGEISSPHVINSAVFSNQPYVYSGIILPPTFKVSSTIVALGSNFTASGYSAPGSVVALEVPGLASLGTATASANGYYQITATASLAPNIYSLRVRATLNGVTSLYSKPIQVLFYTGNLPPGQLPGPPSQLGLCVDYNKDRRVNLIDFSILLFWFQKSEPPPSVDCNADTVIDLKDFSILMYFWTG